MSLTEWLAGWQGWLYSDSQKQFGKEEEVPLAMGPPSPNVYASETLEKKTNARSIDLMPMETVFY